MALWSFATTTRGKLSITSLSFVRDAPADGFPPPELLRLVGSRGGPFVSNHPPDRGDQARDVLVAEVDEARIGLADQVDEADLPRAVEERGRRGGRPLTSGLRASAHEPMVDHIYVISNALGVEGPIRKERTAAATA